MPSTAAQHLLLASLLASLWGCEQLSELSNREGEPLVKSGLRQLTLGQHFPDDGEANVVGGATAPVRPETKGNRG